MSNENERVLFVHAHPDDESILTGGTIALLVDSGAHVTVLTCTRGERGTKIGEPVGDLGAHRVAELANAMAVLGVTDHRLLGASDARWPGKEPRTYRDSGVQNGATGPIPLDAVDFSSFTGAPFGEVAADIAAVIADVDPTIIVSYDEKGGYGHPDNIRAHEAARRAAEVMGTPFFVIESDARSATTANEISDVLERKRAAIGAHASQVVLNDHSFTRADGVEVPIGRSEYFSRLRPPVDQGSSFSSLSIVTKISLIIIVIAVSVAAGLLMTAVQQSTVLIGTVLFPWGIIVALVCAIALLAGLRIVFETRVLPTIAAVGLLGMSALVATPTRGGSVVVAENLAGYLWTFVPIVATFLVLAWPNLRRKAPGKIEPVPAVKGSSIQ